MRHRERASELKTQKGLGSQVDHSYQNKLTEKHLQAGNVSNKFPVPLSDGRTIVFAKTLEDVPRIKKSWEKRIKITFPGEDNNAV